ncbi:hypothetical protein KX928_10060 [Roseobacter sp. YSTF-M11]|uniref:Lipoprotein n=1 Tax=Roseobacter insulae TaxID=2859783 RepID=A0A9X1FUQ8_9RHOB|nr:hypothetical protein [Roseobacter insulae]MBW4708129.1 hypothetical protein [Roseobacter insulae]
MRKTVSALVVSTLVLSACSTRLNPFNWFGNGESVPVATAASEEKNPLLPERSGIFQSRRDREAIYQGTPIETIDELIIERVPGGAIIRATGTAAVQGIYDVQLTPANKDEQAEDGVLTYRLEGLRRDGSVARGAPATRQVTAARRVTDRTLAEARTIRVEGVQNAQQARR